MEALKILCLSVAAAITYGIAQDQVTTRVCLEYFTVGHPPIFATQNPTALAFGWGVVAAWWVGVLLGVPLALVARIGSRPQIAARALVQPVARLMASVGFLAVVASIVGFCAAQAGVVGLDGPLASRVPRERHALFLADLWAHNMAYGAGFLGGIFTCRWVWQRRGQLQSQTLL